LTVPPTLLGFADEVIAPRNWPSARQHTLDVEKRLGAAFENRVVARGWKIDRQAPCTMSPRPSLQGPAL